LILAWPRDEPPPTTVGDAQPHQVRASHEEVHRPAATTGGSGTSGTAGTTTTSSTTPDRRFDTGGRAPVRTDAGDAAYEVHMKKADGSLRQQNREGQDFDAAALPPLRPASFF
jgi:hypothetical protein